ncbi:unnamed protein product [Rotaria sordida]|uniref:C2H2-type domain-containing protein n=1 Tax=Rotaria sordida TaxID=392033 RepID=A0A819BTZ6_9BILA|nr:unnamed protein product [Rotaria sordida]CAF3807664.1 unnamed protein product [Rotaria sordida]
MMESTNTTTDQQTPPTIPINNSSSRRKQSKPNRLEHVVLETASTCDTINSSSILPPLTQYHVAAEQQEGGIGDDDSDRISLNCEDGSLSSHSTGEHYAMEDIINRSRRSSHQHQSRTIDKTNFDENIERMLIEENQQQEHIDHNNETIGILDFSLKIDEANKLSLNSTNRSRSINTTGKSRSLKRKHQNDTIDNNNGTITMPTRIFHADAFCAICRKEFCNKYFLKTHLANKHGIFDHQSIGPSVSTPNLTSIQGNTDTNNDSNLQHPFTVISTLLHNGHEDFSSSPTSPSSDMIQNHQNNDDENETELTSLRHEMNGVIAGDDDNNNDNNNHDHEQDDNDDDDNDADDDDDDEQDGTNTNSLINLPQKIATILCNDNKNMNSVTILNDNDDDQNDLLTNSPTNSLDFQQQQASSSTQIINLPSTPSSTTTTTNLSRQSSAKLLEDFCDICQKHFCNKYYLRKHKLDVHGVQTDCNIKPYKRIDNNSLTSKNSPPSTSSQQNSPSIQLPSSFPNVAFNPSSVQQSLGMLLNPIFSPLVQSQTNTEQTLLSSSNKRRHTDNSNESSSSSLSLSKPQFPQSLLTVASDVFANQLNSVTHSSTTPTTPTTKSQISTCHLCGKKFQTNDYLQLHLMNKHQITTDIQNFDSQQQQQRTKMSNLIKSSNGTLNSNTVKKIKLETNEIPSSSSSTTTTTTTTVIKASSPIDTMTSPNPSAVIPGIVDTYFAAKMADRVSCDICHKQVCNKYFLKTHKLKVHGVGPDPMVTSSSVTITNSETSDDNIEQQQQQSLSSIDGSPPQLVVDEMNTSNIEPGVIPSPDTLTNSVNSFISTNNNINNTTNGSIEQATTSICEICSKSFPTKFLHVHMNNVHGIQQQPISLSNGTTSTNKNILVTNTIKRPLTNGNNLTGNTNVRLKQTPQVQLRVTCQVCKKELCNKYFLRAHMRNVHNISVDDLRLIQQPSTTSSTTSQLSPSSDSQSSKTALSLSSNILSATSTIPTDINVVSTRKYSLTNDNDLNGHITDSNESENINLTKETNNYSSSLITTTKISTNDNNNNNNNNRLLSMQPFLVESDDDVYKDLFVPCMVYLPCRHRVTKPLEVSLRLKPVDNTTSTAATAATAIIAD